jgi:hypothetical protein
MVGLWSWFESLSLGKGRRLVRTQGPVEDPQLDEVRTDALADVAEIEKDDKYFGPDAPANDDLL